MHDEINNTVQSETIEFNPNNLPVHNVNVARRPIKRVTNLLLTLASPHQND